MPSHLLKAKEPSKKANRRGHFRDRSNDQAKYLEDAYDQFAGECDGDGLLEDCPPPWSKNHWI